MSSRQPAPEGSLRDRAGDLLEAVGRRVGGEDISTVDKLFVEVEEGGGVLWGKRIVVPPNEIHVVTAEGLFAFTAKSQTKIYGASVTLSEEARARTGLQDPKQGTMYRKNRYTQVIGLKTITFVVPVAGRDGTGIQVLDSQHVPFTITAHVVAKLDETNPDIAAMRIGHDIDSLVINIKEVTEAELTDAAADLSLAEVIKNRQQLADKAKVKVDETLRGLGYNLVLLKISDLGGEAYQKLVAQAQAIVVRDSTINLNAAQLATAENENERQRREAAVQAETRRTTEAERLAADRDVKRAGLNTTEELAQRQHELAIVQAQRATLAAEAMQAGQLRQVALDQEVDLAQAGRAAQVAARRQADEQKLAQQAAEADAALQALNQERDLERRLAATESEAQRLEREKLAEADRERKVKLVDAEATAQALQRQTEAQTAAELLRATREAEAAQQRAAASKVQAEAQRATEAAAGLAAADVREREVAIAAAQVAVDRDRGLAEAEVTERTNAAALALTRGQREIQIEAETRLAALYAEYPILAELEQIRLANAQALELARVDAEARVKIFQALAPNMRVNLIGDGGRTSQILAQVLAIGNGLQVVGDEVPAIGRLVGANGVSGDGLALPSMGVLGAFLPYVQRVAREADPGVFASMTLAQLVDRLGAVVEGREDLATALNGIRQNAQFRVFANVPVQPLLSGLGVNASDERGAE